MMIFLWDRGNDLNRTGSFDCLGIHFVYRAVCTRTEHHPKSSQNARRGGKIRNSQSGTHSYTLGEISTKYDDRIQ